MGGNATDLPKRMVTAQPSGLDWTPPDGRIHYWRSLLRWAVQHLPHFAPEHRRRERFLEEGDPRFEHPVVDDGVVRVAGEIEHSNPGALGSQASGNLSPVEPRHDYIGHEEVDGTFVLSRHTLSVAPACRDEHRVAVGVQHLLDELANHVIVLHEEDGFGPAHRHRWHRARGGRGDGLRDSGQVNLEACAMTGLMARRCRAALRYQPVNSTASDRGEDRSKKAKSSGSPNCTSRHSRVT